CMDGTRTRIINDTILWTTRSSDLDPHPDSSNVDGILWIYGMPGIGKSAIAHSICHQLDRKKQLGGSFFCRRDDLARSDTKSVLPTLIYELAEISGPYRNWVAKSLRDDPQLESGELFLSSLQSLEEHPLGLALVLDALDECGQPVTRKQLLGHLIKASIRNKWLKIIIISRPESDIRSFFNENGIVGQDLGQDDDSRTDIQYFTETRMKTVADKLHVSQHPEPWIGERRLGHIVNRSGGLFIFVETLSQYLMKYRNPKPSLDRLLEGPSEEASIELQKLYLAAIEARVNSEEAESRLVSRAVIGVAPHRALCDESIATLTGVEVGIVSSWVDDLSSLLYRDKAMKEGIRVRHISILEYLTGPFCPLDFRVDVKQADVELSIYCLQTMMTKLRFNICRLETSYLPNSDIENLHNRVQENISDILQYCCLNWSNHLCASPDPASKEVCELMDALLKGEYFLYWLETLSVMGKVPAAIMALRRIIACSRIANLAKEALRFVLAFLAPISISAPHIYLSALPFTPSESSVWKNTLKSFPELMGVSDGRMTKWFGVGDLWKGHTNSINALAYSPDGLNVVSGSSDYTVRIWDAATGAPVGDPLRGHTNEVTSVVYSPDGRNIVSGSQDKTIRIWDAATGMPIGEPLMGHKKAVTRIACSPDGQNIVSSSWDTTVRIWDASTGEPVGDPLMGHTDGVDSVAYSPDGRNIASGSYDKTIRIWDAGHTGGVTSIAYSPDGQNIVSSAYDNTLRIWDAATGAQVGDPLMGHTYSASSVAYSPNGRNIVSGSSDQTIRMWDAATGRSIAEPLMGHLGAIKSVAYSPDGYNIITGSSDCTIRIWDATTGVPVNVPLRGHDSIVRSVAYSSDGQHIVSGSSDRTVRIWDAKTGASVGEPLRGHNGPVTSVTYSPNGRNIASGSADMTIRIWDVATRALVCEPLTGHTGDVNSVTYLPDSQRLVSGSHDNTIRIWDTATGASVGQPLRGHTQYVTSVACSTDGQYIVSASFDKTIRIWDAATGAPIGEPLTGHLGTVKGVAYSPDGRTIVSGSGDNTIRIWDAATGAPIGDPLKGHSGLIEGVACSPDGRHIVSGAFDCTIRI
ncbi:hypothetical protein M408DRAFT_37709, partial [Serendipita vermifera MAFF 305830]